MRPEVHPIKTESLPRFEGGIPHIIRKFSHPPGLNKPEILGTYGLYNQDEIDGVIESSPTLSVAGKKLLNGLRAKGGVALFGSETEYDLGLNYSDLCKTCLDEEVMTPALEELANKMRLVAQKNNFTIDGVLAPEMSALLQAKAFTSFLHDTECYPVKKNGEKSSVAVAVDSYTKGRTDVISLPATTLEKLKIEQKTNLVLSDDIVDAGYMTQAISLLLQLAREQKQEYDVNLVGIVAPIEKTYTKARKNIQKELGKDIPIFSILQIEDIGLLNDAQAWIKVKGIEKAIPCNLFDFRIK